MNGHGFPSALRLLGSWASERLLSIHLDADKEYRPTAHHSISYYQDNLLRLSLDWRRSYVILLHFAPADDRFQSALRRMDEIVTRFTAGPKQTWWPADDGQYVEPLKRETLSASDRICSMLKEYGLS